MEGTIGTNGYVANEMYDRINYGRGGNGLYAGNSVLAAGAHADGTAIGAKLDCDANRFSDNISAVSRQFEDAQRNAQVNSLNENLSDSEFRTDAKFTSLNKNISDSEFRTIDRNRDIERLIIEGQKETAKCCCDAKLEAQKNACDTQRLIIEKAATTDALILAVESRANLDKLAEARAENTYLKTVAELGDRHHHHRG